MSQTVKCDVCGKLTRLVIHKFEIGGNRTYWREVIAPQYFKMEDWKPIKQYCGPACSTADHVSQQS